MMLAFVVASVVQSAACHTIAADRIYARDLAAAAPAFAALPPNLEVGFGPAPGQTRVFHPADLRRIADAHQIKAEFPNDMCFSWQMAVPTREAILASIGKTLAGRNAQVELLDQSLVSAPVGELVFPLSGLSGVSEEAVTWRGYVLYAGDRHYMIWARVRVRVKENHILPTEPLKPDVAITPDQLRLTPYEGPLLRDKLLTDLSAAIGLVPRRPLPAGVPLTENDLDRPRDVERGDTVQVIAVEGRAHIEAQGVAEEGGRRGAVITVRNGTSGKKFRARVEEKDKVLVIPGTSSGLAVEEKKL
jgi:flagella basal body P-ring formation protein FlgA